MNTENHKDRTHSVHILEAGECVYISTILGSQIYSSKGVVALLQLVLVGVHGSKSK